MTEDAMFIVQRLDAPNTPNGNPRRVYVVYSIYGLIVGCYDEGYLGHKALPEEILSHKLIWLHNMKVTVAVYKHYLNWGKDIKR